MPSQKFSWRETPKIRVLFFPWKCGEQKKTIKFTIFPSPPSPFRGQEVAKKSGEIALGQTIKSLPLSLTDSSGLIVPTTGQSSSSVRVFLFHLASHFRLLIFLSVNFYELSRSFLILVTFTLIFLLYSEGSFVSPFFQKVLYFIVVFNLICHHHSLLFILRLFSANVGREGLRLHPS